MTQTSSFPLINPGNPLSLKGCVALFLPYPRTFCVVFHNTWVYFLLYLFLSRSKLLAMCQSSRIFSSRHQFFLIVHHISGKKISFKNSIKAPELSFHGLTLVVFQPMIQSQWPKRRNISIDLSVAHAYPWSWEIGQLHLNYKN